MNNLTGGYDLELCITETGGVLHRLCVGEHRKGGDRTKCGERAAVTVPDHWDSDDGRTKCERCWPDPFTTAPASQWWQRQEAVAAYLDAHPEIERPTKYQGATESEMGY